MFVAKMSLFTGVYGGFVANEVIKDELK